MARLEKHPRMPQPGDEAMKPGPGRGVTFKMPTIQEIDADTWAESGGTGGIFGRLHAKGLLRIVPIPDDHSQIVPKL